MPAAAIIAAAFYFANRMCATVVRHLGVFTGQPEVILGISCPSLSINPRSPD